MGLPWLISVRLLSRLDNFGAEFQSVTYEVTYHAIMAQAHAQQQYISQYKQIYYS